MVREGRREKAKLIAISTCQPFSHIRQQKQPQTCVAIIHIIPPAPLGTVVNQSASVREAFRQRNTRGSRKYGEIIHDYESRSRFTLEFVILFHHQACGRLKQHTQTSRVCQLQDGGNRIVA